MRWLPDAKFLPLTFDFQARPDIKLQRVAWIFLVVVLIFCADVAFRYWEARNLLLALEIRIADIESRQPQFNALPEYVPRAPDLEIAFARNTIKRISLPWEDILSGVGGSLPEDVALLEVSPDANSSILQITARAQSLEKMLAYVAQLENFRLFKEVTLTHHEFSNRDPRLPISFSVQLSWKLTR